ncbi:MAG: cell division ATP-binding protein FtsE [Acidobacteriota bacterium]
MIRFFGVTKRFPGGQTALRDVSFDLDAGEFVFLTGASGAGKTTLLRLIYREDVPSEGQILVNGRNVVGLPAAKVPYLRRSIGVVFQDFRLIPRKTVFENVCYLPMILGESVKRQKEIVLDALQSVGLGHRMNAFPRELSGGEQQRVSVARALINRPDILLADEPTGNLDPELSLEIMHLFAEVNRRGTTVLLASHDPGMIARLGGRVLTLDNGELVNDDMEEPILGPDPAESLT